MEIRGPRESTRKRLVDAAARLFYAGGIHTTGIEAIVEAAEVSKPTLYRYFQSKDQIIAAALEMRARDRFVAVDHILDHPSADEPLLGVFDELETFIAAPNFRGCALINAAAELTETTDSARAIAAHHKRQVGASLERVATERGYRRPAQLARALLMLMEGATVLAALDGNPAHAKDAKAAAATLLEAHRP